MGSVVAWLETETDSEENNNDTENIDTTPSDAHPTGTVHGEQTMLSDSGHAASVITPAQTTPESSGAPAGAGFISPRSKRRIDELGIHSADLAAIRGTGRGGRVTANDLEQFLGSMEDLPQETADPSRLAIADAMRRSWTRPLATVARRVLLDKLLAHRRTVAGRPSLTVYAARALALVLEDDKRIARRLIGRKLYTPPGCGIAVAVAVDEALLTPTVAGVHKGSLADAAEAVDSMITDARAGRMKGNAVEAIAAVSNYGSLDLTWATPIPPAEQSLLLGIGRVESVPSWDPTSKSWARAAGAESPSPLITVLLMAPWPPTWCTASAACLNTRNDWRSFQLC